MVTAQTIEKLEIDWSVAPRIQAFTTTRHGGVSSSGFASLNLAQHVGDKPEAVFENRRLLAVAHADVQQWQWLNQVHGSRVFKISPACNQVANTPSADAIVCSKAGVACCVMTADCLPLFLASESSDEVAIAHVGWRGLVAGVIERTIAAMQSESKDIVAAFGPAIGPSHFEVGEEVLDALGYAPASEDSLSGPFRQSENRGKYLADLFRLAELRLQALGVKLWQSPRFCTYADPVRFFSHRRSSHLNQTSGRMVSVIYLQS